MTRLDDSALTSEQFATVAKHADRLLREASALDVFPTPIDRLMAAAKLTVVEDKFLDEGFLAQFRKAAKSSLNAVKSALGKVLGMLHVADRLVLIDLHTPPAKKPFLQLHEAGHSALPHQSSVYALIHDSEKSLDPDVTELFEREANAFAAEVLFQGANFAVEAHQSGFGISVPMDLAKKYGASNYATFRRYVESNPAACCLIVLEPAVPGLNNGFTAPVRRILASKSYNRTFDPTEFGGCFSNHHPLGHIVPIGRRMTRARSITLCDRNGSRRKCTAEAFDSKHHVFILIRDLGPAPTVLLPKPSARTTLKSF